MALLIKSETAEGFARLPAVRQLGLMVVLAASVALGVAVVLWSREPSYALLYGNLAEQDASQVLDALQKARELQESLWNDIPKYALIDKK